MGRTIIKIILSVVACVVGSATLIGGVVFAKAASDYYKLDFDNYETLVAATGETIEERDKAIENSRITYPTFKGNLIVYSWIDYDVRLIDCYVEVQSPCHEYAMSVWNKYGENAELTFTIENTGKLLTIKFTGTGYPENGEPVDLSRTYIFDIDGAGVSKLPRLVNRAEFIGY